jgi:UDP-N-acetylmuramate: L-alanyl-gamma-D-glutamyl-meso-diaminopimelate ligase
LKATTSAVKEQYPNRNVVACMELHTFSSLRKEFLPLYDGAMNAADEALVYFSPAVVAHKKLEPLTLEQVQNAFGGKVKVVNKTEEVLEFIKDKNWNDSVLLMMSSGNFDGIDYEKLGADLLLGLSK